MLRPYSEWSSIGLPITVMSLIIHLKQAKNWRELVRYKETKCLIIFFHENRRQLGCLREVLNAAISQV